MGEGFGWSRAAMVREEVASQYTTVVCAVSLVTLGAHAQSGSPLRGLRAPTMKVIKKLVPCRLHLEESLQ
jgi:hypothetical protein